MSDFVRMEGDIPITSASAAASLSIEDARFVKSKLHNIEIVSCSDQLWSWVVGLAAVGSISAGLYAMWVEASLIVYIAFVAPLITAPMVLVQRQKLQWMPNFREEENRMRLKVNAMAAKRVQLGIEIRRLERQVHRMADIERRFEYVVRREGGDLEYFRKLVKENVKIQAEMKKAQATRELMDMFSTILKSDRNGDNVVSYKEAEEFLRRVRVCLGDKVIDEDMVLAAFQKTMKKSFGLGSMFDIIKNAMSGEEKKEPVAPESRSVWLNNPNQRPSEEVVEDGFVKVYKMPRVAPTGLVLSDSKESGEGNLAHPIKVEDLINRDSQDGNAYQDDEEIGQSQRYQQRTPIHRPTTWPDTSEPNDVVAAVLQSFSGLMSS